MMRLWHRSFITALLATVVGCTGAGLPRSPLLSVPHLSPPTVTPCESPLADDGADDGAAQASVANRSDPTPSSLPEIHSIQPASFDEQAEVVLAEPEEVVLPGHATSLQARTVAEAISTPSPLEASPPDRQPLPIDLTDALAMAAGESPQIAFAAARYREAYARLQAAQVLWLPSLRAGLSYNHHDGQLQASDGGVISASRSSFQSGLGTRAVGAGSPMIHGVAAEFHTTTAVFQPRITTCTANARNAAVGATRNDVLLQVALGYTELLRALQQAKIAEETLRHAELLASLTDQYAQAGQGSQADADRTRTELVKRKNDVSRASESVRVANVRLAEILSLAPSLEIVPQESTIVPIDLVDIEVPAAELVATGLSNRPELAEASHLVCEAVYRYRREKYAPWLPSVLLGLSQSDFGGGLGSSIDNTDGRFDFDATVYWELRNMGFGEKAKRRETRSLYDQARAAQVAIMDRVAREVVEAHAQVQARQTQIAVAKSGVEAATQSYDRNVTRIREGQGLPIETLQSIQALDDARREYLRTLADYNAAQFRLQRAVGWPIR